MEDQVSTREARYVLVPTSPAYFLMECFGGGVIEQLGGGGEN